VREFHTDQDALDYLSGRIAAEANREGVSLSEIERKMLYFSETDWTLPEMAAVSDEFNQVCDENEYEKKIAGLIRKIEANDHSGNQQERDDWNEAVRKLSNGDRYIQIMLDSSFRPLEPSVRPLHDRLNLWLIAFAIVFGFFGLAGLLSWLFGPHVADWIFGHGGLGILPVLVVLIWVFRSGLKDIRKTLPNKW
jgi:hypothetical protein